MVEKARRPTRCSLTDGAAQRAVDVVHELVACGRRQVGAQQRLAARIGTRVDCRRQLVDVEVVGGRVEHALERECDQLRVELDADFVHKRLDARHAEHYLTRAARHTTYI